MYYDILEGRPVRVDQQVEESEGIFSGCVEKLLELADAADFGYHNVCEK